MNGPFSSVRCHDKDIMVVENWIPCRLCRRSRNSGRYLYSNSTGSINSLQPGSVTSIQKRYPFDSKSFNTGMSQMG